MTSAALSAAMATPALGQEQQVTPGPAAQESSGPHVDAVPESDTASAKPAPPKRPTFKLTRWLEDWRPLADPALRTDPLDPLKYIPLNSTGLAHLTLSGQLREEAVVQSASLFARTGDSWLLHRLYVGADLHLGEARLFAEVGNALETGRKGGPGPTDEDKLDLQLLFADWRLTAGTTEVVARVGRQELAFDPTQRFVGVREGPNLRQAFDAVRLNVRRGPIHLSAFAGRPVAYRPGAFDDERNRELSFKGVYLAYSRGSAWRSVYVYDYRRDNARFGQAQGRERRTAWGIRVADRRGGLDYDIEAMVQHGSVGEARVRAWAVAALAGWTFQDLPWRPRLGLQADLASGDRNARDGRVETFNPLFYKGNYFTEAPVATMANVRHVKLSLSARPSPNFTWSVSVADLSRERSGDLVYIAPLVPQPLSAAVGNRHIGAYAQGLVSRQFGRHSSVSLEAARFLAADRMQAIGAHNVSFAKLTTNFLF